MKTVLGIESSCDETAAAVVVDGREIRSSIVDSQAPEHARWGGVVPEIASRSHLRSIRPVIDAALDEAGIGLGDLDAIAVTSRPGLIGSLLVGVSAAKGLALGSGLPLIGVHHIEAHVYASLMERGDAPFPCLALVVSGGHTALYRVDGYTEMTLLRKTLDDAAGEAFDKVSSMLGAGYPGGPAISKLAREGDRAAVRFPRYRAKPERPSFSFSGLKTAVLYHIRGDSMGGQLPPPETITNRADIAASFEEAAVDSLVKPTIEVALAEGCKTVLVGGGVACNTRLREKLTAAAEKHGIEARFPAPAYCTDNAAMIAGLGYQLLEAGEIAGLGLAASPR